MDNLHTSKANTQNELENTMTMYQVINRNTQAIVGTYKTKNAARNAVDRKDAQYGAYVHSVRAVEVV